MATSTSLRLFIAAVAVLLAGSTVSAQTSLSQLLTLPPPDSSAIGNAMKFANCAQPGGADPTMFSALPNNDMLPFIQQFPELAGPMIQISCNDLKNDASKAMDLISQLAQGKISPQDFIKKMLQIDPHITDLLKGLVQDAKKTLDNIIQNLPDGPLKQMLQQASSFLGQVLQDPVSALTPAVQAAQSAFQSLSPQMQQYLMQAGGQVPQAIGMLSNMLTGPPQS